MKKFAPGLAALFFVVIVNTLLVFCVRKGNSGSNLNITHPFMNALLPPEFPAPVFEWWTEVPDSSVYEITLSNHNEDYVIHATTDKHSWTPDESQWDSLKVASDFKKIHFRVRKKGRRNAAYISFKLSRDSVNAPILYRQMPIPFITAEQQLDSMKYMLLNVGSKREPHTTMKGFSVCGNCHSFTDDGRTIGLDLDAGLRDKGGYFVAQVDDTIRFDQSNFNSWSKLEKSRTFGLFSKLSPDGRYIVTTVKDRVLVKNFEFPPLENVKYSQLFFPVNGHLAVYDRQTDTFGELPGANLPEYVQSNATWSADGKYIIFSRAKALPADSSDYDIIVRDEELIQQYVDRKKTLKYDLYKIPFNEGRGGKAEPIKGASNNGKSNYFPAVSPDGKWIIYCEAENFMLLMPDSRLYIVPVEGGKSRELRCNFNSMNSWHAWSPNSSWIVFASKVLSPYTDMFLAHIDEDGEASIPVLVDKARAPYRVINYPEFLNRDPEDPFVMSYDFVELAHIERAVIDRDWDKARQLYFRLEKQDLYFFREDYEQLSVLLNKMGLPEEAKKYDELASQTVDATVFEN